MLATRISIFAILTTTFLLPMNALYPFMFACITGTCRGGSWGSLSSFAPDAESALLSRQIVIIIFFLNNFLSRRANDHDQVIISKVQEQEQATLSLTNLTTCAPIIQSTLQTYRWVNPFLSLEFSQPSPSKLCSSSFSPLIGWPSG